jgi:hypothetical protein
MKMSRRDCALIAGVAQQRHVSADVSFVSFVVVDAE